MKKLILTIALTFSLASTSAIAQKVTEVTSKAQLEAMSPDDVIADLKKGNEHFVEGKLTNFDYMAQVKNSANGQNPKAVILSCLDSRVPVETIFNQGIGDLFVGRVAGNIETSEQIGSYEFATGIVGSKVIVVLGHTSCGAVKGTIDQNAVSKLGHTNLNALVEEINPAVLMAMKDGDERSSSNTALVNRSVEKNVELTISDIRTQSQTLSNLEKEGAIKIVGAIYDIKTGKVSWMDN
jgi:carbonic anhydrase